MTSQKSQGQIVGLDLLRAAAALFVMAFHLAYWFWAGGYLPKPLQDGGLLVLTPVTWFGWVGVEVFFVLSGFVIAFSASHATPINFARGRFLRLYPTAWICATVTLAVLLWSSHGMNARRELTGWVHAAILSPRALWIDGSYWTLPVELCFYGIIFLLLLSRSFRRLDVVMALLGLYSTVVCFYRLRTDLSHTHGIVWLVGNGHTFPTAAIFLRYGLYFSIGAFLWLCLFQRVTAFRCACLAVFACGAFAEISEHTAEIVRISHPAHVSPWVPFVAWLFTLMLMVVSIRRNASIHAALGRRGTSIARTLGLMTYPLYLIHQQAGYALLPLFSRHLPIPLAVVVLCGLFLAVSYVIVTYLEKPLRLKLQGLLQGKQKTQAYHASRTELATTSAPQ